MKRKIMAVTLTAAMLAGLAAVPVWADDTGSDEGKVLNIYCWNEEFKSRLTDHYPGYEEVDGTHGKIGDVDVVWNITPSDDNAYQSFSGKEDDMSGNVKFVIETAAIDDDSDK